jgi:hypothetical protein
MVRYVQIVKVVANTQIILRNTVAAPRILLRATGVVRSIVIPNLYAIVPKSKVFGRNMRYKIVVVDESPVIWKHKI